MRFSSGIRFLSGLVAMVAAALLSAPGVRVAVADESGSSQIERFLAQNPVASTTASSDAGERARAHEAFLQKRVAQAQAQFATRPQQRPQLGAQRGVIALNNRGFNYAEGETFPFAPGALVRPSQ